MKKMTNCKDCNKIIDSRAIRCNSCAKLRRYRTKKELLRLKKQFTGKNNPKWNKGKRIHTSGYIMLNTKYYPHNTKTKYIFEHRYLVEKFLGYKLTKKQTIHHIDGNKSNNALKNLYVFPTCRVHSGFELLIKHNIINRFYLISNVNSLKKLKEKQDG